MKKDDLLLRLKTDLMLAKDRLGRARNNDSLTVETKQVRCEMIRREIERLEDEIKKFER